MFILSCRAQQLGFGLVLALLKEFERFISTIVDARDVRILNFFLVHVSLQILTKDPLSVHVRNK